jgi:hopanoid biosynthesis associated protein HpnK
MLKLIVHADDFGLSKQTNDGILKSHLDGILTSTSLMANGAAFDHAVSLCSKVPTLDVGLHLTLVEELPILDPHHVASLVDRQGKLCRHATVFTTRYFAGRIDFDEVRAEMEAQIQKVRSHGLRISHLDSHQHVHMLPEILRITVALARKYGINVVRFPREALQPYMLRAPWGIPRVGQLLWLRFLCSSGRHAEVFRTDHFVGFFFGGKLDKERLRIVLDYLPRTGTCELMCHPGLDDPATRYAHWGYHWPDELNALLDPDIADFLRSRCVSLTSYRDLQIS